MRTAWLLGAGFSYSLGGPLLADFFTEARRTTVWPYVKELGEETAGAITQVHRLYWNNSTLGRRGDLPTHRPWNDPEEFLAILDAAAREKNCHEARVLSDIDAGSYAAGRAAGHWRAAARYVAMVTDHFVPKDRRTAETLERWQPYLHWGARLSKSLDSVITFNYDRVVELVVGDALKVLSPDKPTSRQSKPWIVKLHGSMNWWEYRDPDTGKVLLAQQPHVDARAMHILGHDPYIAMPGPSKYETADRLETLWDAAEADLAHAERIVVIGYRFPPSDSAARHRLLGAIRKNENPKISIHVVLGADTNLPDVRRIAGLVEWVKLRRDEVGRRTEVRIEPLFAEDFIALDGG